MSRSSESPISPEAHALRVRLTQIWRLEAPHLIAHLSRRLRNLEVAEELAQEALLAALDQWPREGVPDKPGAWLSRVAHNRGLDRLRRESRLSRIVPQLAYLADLERPTSERSSTEDELLGLMFLSCHPKLAAPARVALTLRLLGGLSTEEIARAFLTKEATIAQRIVRAKKQLAGEAFEVPEGPERAARVDAVLEVIYLIFNEGYSATRGERWFRGELCEQAQRLARILAARLPKHSEVLGLLALLELQASRLGARLDPHGKPILLLDQNRARWDQLLISRGLSVLHRAEALNGAGHPQGSAPKTPGNYQLQAAIAACHARARQASDTDWMRIASLYAQLVELTGSPIVELNRGMAVAMASGPAAGLSILDPLHHSGILASYAPLAAARGDLLARLGHITAARAELLRAAQLSENLPERELLLAKVASLA
jgi:RNA polymerase sigma-70 factor (ECF subfamily)